MILTRLLCHLSSPTQSGFLVYNDTAFDWIKKVEDTGFRLNIVSSKSLSGICFKNIFLAYFLTDLISFHLFFLNVFLENLRYLFFQIPNLPKNLMNCYLPLRENHLKLNYYRGGSRAAATSKLERFVIIVNGFQPLTIITKNSILDVAAALDSPLYYHQDYISFTLSPSPLL